MVTSDMNLQHKVKFITFRSFIQFLAPPLRAFIHATALSASRWRLTQCGTPVINRNMVEAVYTKRMPLSSKTFLEKLEFFSSGLFPLPSISLHLSLNEEVQKQ